MPQNTKRDAGFTLVELLVVIAIIALLSSVVLAAMNGARDAAQESRVYADLRQVVTAMEFLSNDTAMYPFGNNPELSACTATTEFGYLSDPGAGLINTDSSFPGWDGPYIPGGASVALRDPWGNRYVYDDQYDCSFGAEGCGSFDSDVRAIYSGGGNSSTEEGAGGTIGESDSDDIVRVLCGG